MIDYSKLVAVTGLPGLFELVASKTDGAIVRSLEDKTTRFVASRIHNFSHLESIEVYTVRENVNLVDVLKAMDKTGTTLPDDKDAAAVKKYFESVFPDMDFERVYASDMKKMIKWFDILKKNNIEIKLTEIPEEEPEIEEIKVEPEVKKVSKTKEEPKAKEKPGKAAQPEEKKTKTAKKTATKKADKEKQIKEEKKPAKKAAAKKK
jgi:hypothetical protein